MAWTKKSNRRCKQIHHRTVEAEITRPLGTGTYQRVPYTRIAWRLENDVHTSKSRKRV